MVHAIPIETAIKKLSAPTKSMCLYLSFNLKKSKTQCWGKNAENHIFKAKSLEMTSISRSLVQEDVVLHQTDLKI